MEAVAKLVGGAIMFALLVVVTAGATAVFVWLTAWFCQQLGVDLSFLFADAIRELRGIDPVPTSSQ